MGIFPPEVTIAAVLIIIAVVVVLVSKMGILPKKSLPFIAGGLASVFGIAVFKGLRDKSLRSDLKRRERELQELAERAAQTAAGVSAADVQRTAALAEVQRQQEAVSKERLLIQARTAAEKEAISQLQGEELFERYVQVFGNR